ncbi:MAG: hypothetical protein ACR2OF_08740 [Hyphomicrobium sp.]
MQIKDLEIFNEMPFLFWVKEEERRYLWGNRTISQLAKENLVGKMGPIGDGQRRELAEASTT